MSHARILKLTSNLQHIVVHSFRRKIKDVTSSINADKLFGQLSESPNCNLFLLKFRCKRCNNFTQQKNTHIYSHRGLLTGRTRAYLDIVMVELLADSKSVWLDKLVGVYQLTYMCFMDSVTEVNRDTVVMVEAFESTFIKARNLQSCQQ